MTLFDSYVYYLGCGERMTRQLAPEIREHFRAKGISVEMSSTTNAAATFNTLNAEGREVGAALLTLYPYDVRNTDLEGDP